LFFRTQTPRSGTVVPSGNARWEWVSNHHKSDGRPRCSDADARSVVRPAQVDPISVRLDPVPSRLQPAPHRLEPRPPANQPMPVPQPPKPQRLALKSLNFDPISEQNRPGPDDFEAGPDRFAPEPEQKEPGPDRFDPEPEEKRPGPDEIEAGPDAFVPESERNGPGPPGGESIAPRLRMIPEGLRIDRRRVANDSGGGCESTAPGCE